MSTDSKARRRKRRGPSLLTGLRLVLIILIVAAVSAFGTLFVVKRVSIRTSETVAMRLKNIGELATQAAYFTNVQTITDSRTIAGWTIPFTTSKAIFSYDGTIKAGVDFSAIVPAVDPETKTITLTCPAVAILSVEIDPDSLKVYDEQHSAFAPIDIAGYTASTALLKSEAQQKAVENGLLDNARSNAEQLLSGMLLSLPDLEGYRVEFVWK